MADVKISPTPLFGEVTVPASKSDCHRAIICAALSGGKCTLSPVTMSKDIEATIGCVRALGVAVTLDGDTLTVDGTHLMTEGSAVLDCGESGSTLRFMIPVVSSLNVSAVFTGHGRLPQRPIGIYLDTLPKHGVSCVTEGGLPLSVSGQLTSGDYRLPGNVSSQFVTGLMLALHRLDGDSRIILTSPMESVGYVDMTIASLSRFNVRIDRGDSLYALPGKQRCMPLKYAVEGDWSQAAFFIVAGALGGELTVQGIPEISTQGDRDICRLMRELGADLTQAESSVTVRNSALHGIEIDAGQIPDLVPVLAVAAAGAKGTTRIYNAERLRIKESDRIKTTVSLINSLGGNAEETSDGLLIHGTGRLRGGTVNGSNDHRIVMSAAVASLICDDAVRITDAEAVGKSYPKFFEDFNKLGGKAVWLLQ